MSIYNHSDPRTRPMSELRRLSHSAVVTTAYVGRKAEIDPQSIDLRRDQAVREGYEDGYADGLAKAAVEAAAAREEESRRAEVAFSALSRALNQLQGAEKVMRAEIQQAAPKLAFELVKELLAREVELATNPGRDAVVRALALDEGSQSATLRLNPNDIETLGEIADVTLGREVCIIGDSDIERGGALVEIGNATLDAQLGPALDRVRRVLLGPDGIENRK